MSQAGTKQKGIDGFTLKWIAAVTMLIDHIAAGILEVYVGGGDSPIDWVYLTMRCIGRLAFPLYAFLLVEGLMHTRSRRNYALRLALFSLISEVPFDLTFSQGRWNWGYQNVFFTLTIGFGVIWMLDELFKRVSQTDWKRWVWAALTVLLGMGLAWFLQTDYAGIGVASIAVLYFLRHTPDRGMTEAVAILVFSSLLELVALVDVFFVSCYHGVQRKGGKMGNLKWFFYVFYPAHLLVIWLIRNALT